MSGTGWQGAGQDAPEADGRPDLIVDWRAADNLRLAAQFTALAVAGAGVVLAGGAMVIPWAPLDPSATESAWWLALLRAGPTILAMLYVGLLYGAFRIFLEPNGSRRPGRVAAALGLLGGPAVYFAGPMGAAFVLYQFRVALVPPRGGAMEELDLIMGAISVAMAAGGLLGALLKDFGRLIPYRTVPGGSR